MSTPVHGIHEMEENCHAGKFSGTPSGFISEQFAVGMDAEAFGRCQEPMQEELLEERRKTLILEAQVLELHKMVEESAQHGMLLVERNDELQRRLTQFHQEAEKPATPDPKKVVDDQQKLEELQRSNEALQLQLATAQEASLSDERDGRARKSIEDLSQKSEKLQRERDYLQEHVTSLSEAESVTRRSAEESARKVQQLQRQCTELQDKLNTAIEAQNDARSSAEEAQRKNQELQRECTRLRDDAEVETAESPGRERMQSECERLRERVANVVESESEACHLMDQLKDLVAVAESAEHEATSLAEERLHLCEHKHEHLRAQTTAVEDLEEQLRKVSEDAAIKSRQLQQQIVSASEGELHARRKVEEGLEKNRQLLRQCDQLREKIGASSEAERLARAASQEWQTRSVQLEHENELMQEQIHAFSQSVGRSSAADDELFRMEQLELENDERQLRQLVSKATEAERHACHSASAELLRLRCECEDLRQKMSDVEDRERREMLHDSMQSDESDRNLQLQAKCALMQHDCDKHRKDMVALVEAQRATCSIVEPEMESSPQLDMICQSTRDLSSLSPEFGSGLDTVSVESPTSSSRLHDSIAAVAEWEQRAAQEIVAREAMEARLRVAVCSIEEPMLRPEYEHFRQQAGSAEREAHKHMEELLRKNKDLQQEREHLRKQVDVPLCAGKAAVKEWESPDSDKIQHNLQRECDELREKLLAATYRGEEQKLLVDLPTKDMEDLARHELLQHECEELRRQVAGAMEVDGEVCKLVDQLREQLQGSVSKERFAQGLAEERLRRCEQLECECKRLMGSASAAAAAQPLLQDAATADAWHQCEQLNLECQRLRAELAQKTIATAASGHLLEDAAAAEAIHRYEQLEQECERLRDLSVDSAKASAAAQPLLEDAAATQEEDLELELWSCLESGLRRNQDIQRDYGNDCSRLRQELEVATQAELDARRCAEAGHESNEQLLCELLEHRTQIKRHEDAEKDARGAFQSGLVRHDQLQRTYETLRQHNTSQADQVSVAMLEATAMEHGLHELREEAASAVQAERLQAEAAHLSREEAKVLSQEVHELRKKAALTAEGERAQAEAARSSREEAKALGQELHQLRERAARSAEAEHTARRSAEAASELMRRKDDLRRAREMKDQVSRAVEADKEARRSAEAAVGLKRLIHDLGHGHVNPEGLAMLEASPSRVPLPMSTSPAGTSSLGMASLIAAPVKALTLPSFGI